MIPHPVIPIQAFNWITPVGLQVLRADIMWHHFKAYIPDSVRSTQHIEKIIIVGLEDTREYVRKFCFGDESVYSNTTNNETSIITVYNYA